MKPFIEICCPSVETAVIAEQLGADRVELCINLQHGGTTPLPEDLIKIKQLVKIPVHVLIRCRVGNFVFTATEIERMIEQIELCKRYTIDGVVIGALLSNGEIDIINLNKMVAAAKPMHITFHKAFDECSQPLKVLEQLIDAGIQQILTSGQQPTATAGIAILKQLHQLANNRITIMAGGGIRSNNAKQIVNETGIIAIHSAAGVMNGLKTFKAEIRQIKSLRY